MEITVNKPLAETFGWLQAGAKRIDLQDKIQNISYVLGPGESRVLFLEDPGASEYEITLGEGARMDLVQLREASGKGLSYNNAIHTGKRTQSAISASGVLADKASKLMRGTIDFRTGCSGSVGNETEDVLLLSEEVRNQSVPVILCSEEDVVGNHGASIGRPDEDMLFYMETRGVDEETACEMLARAKIDSVIGRIPDESVREKIRAKVQRGE